MTRLFGTDGIRGVANVDLKPSLAHALGRAVAGRLAGPGGRLLVGQDTRRSGDMLVAGARVGRDVGGRGRPRPRGLPDARPGVCHGRGRLRGRRHGVRVPQPGCRQRAQGARRAGHEARRRAGGRAGDPPARRRRAAQPAQRGHGPPRRRACRDRPVPGAIASPSPDAPGRTCASTSTAPTDRARRVAPAILAESGANVEAHFDAPDGMNINLDCGATAPAALAAIMASDGRRRRRSASTGTRTAAWRSTSAARSSTATSCWGSSRSTASRAGRSPRAPSS